MKNGKLIVFRKCVCTCSCFMPPLRNSMLYLCQSQEKKKKKRWNVYTQTDNSSSDSNFTCFASADLSAAVSSSSNWNLCSVCQLKVHLPNNKSRACSCQFCKLHKLFHTQNSVKLSDSNSSVTWDGKGWRGVCRHIICSFLKFWTRNSEATRVFKGQAGRRHAVIGDEDLLDVHAQKQQKVRAGPRGCDGFGDSGAYTWQMEIYQNMTVPVTCHAYSDRLPETGGR